MDGVSAEDGAERVFEETDQTMRKLIAAAQRLERLPSWFQPEGNFVFARNHSLMQAPTFITKVLGGPMI